MKSCAERQWMDGQLDERVSGQMDGREEGCWTDGQRIIEWTDALRAGLTKEQIIQNQLKVSNLKANNRNALTHTYVRPHRQGTLGYAPSPLNHSSDPHISINNKDKINGIKRNKETLTMGTPARLFATKTSSEPRALTAGSEREKP